MYLSFFDNGILIKLSDSEKPNLLMLIFLEENIKTHDVRTANIRHAEVNWIGDWKLYHDVLVRCLSRNHRIKPKIKKNMITTSRTANVYTVC